MNWLALGILLGILGASSPFTLAYAQVTPPDCRFTMDCPIDWEAPLEWMIYPFELEMGAPFFHMLVWGMVLGVIQIKGQNPMLTGLVGLLIFAALSTTAAYTSTETSQLWYWGIVLLAVGIGAVVFYLLWFKLRTGA